MRSDLRIIAIVACYNEADIIGQTVGDLVRQGIRVHLLDHHSTDGTLDVVRSYVERGQVQVEMFPPGGADHEDRNRFALARIIARKEQLARELDADWFINHDADEFRESPWPELSLRDGIERVDRDGYNAIDFAVLNFWPTDDRFDPSADIRQAFSYFEYGESFNRAQVRCWKKVDDLEMVSTAGHEARFASRAVFPLRFVLRHYPIRGQIHGQRKVLRERQPRFAVEERNQGWHVQYDHVDSSHDFIRDPRTLLRYDPIEVRIHLQLHHRGVEELESRLATSIASRNTVASQLASTRGELVAKGAELDAIEARLNVAQASLASVTRQLQEARVDRPGAKAELEAERAAHRESQARLAAEQRHRDSLEQQIHGYEGELADIRNSHSWQVTRPLRSLWRLLGRQ